MSSIERIVIIGAGLAGARAAEALRKDGFAGSITLVGDEPDRPYLRPPLSKEYLRAESDREKVYVHPRELLRRAAHRPADRKRGASDRRRFARGRARRRRAASFRPVADRDGSTTAAVAIPGSNLPGVVTFRTLADADKVREAAVEAERIVVDRHWLDRQRGQRVASDARTRRRRDRVRRRPARASPRPGDRWRCTATSISRMAWRFVPARRSRGSSGPITSRRRDRSGRADRRRPRRRGHRGRTADRARPRGRSRCQ